MIKFRYIIIFLFGLSAFSQQNIFKGDPDRAFEVARELAFNKKRKQAQDTLLLILTKYPNYHDIRAFLASTYSWDGEYKKAKEAFSYVLKKDPERLTTWEAAIKNELYSEATFSALKMTQKALEYFPDNADLLYLKATAEDNSNRKEDALLTIERVLKTNPDHEKAKSLKSSLVEQLRHNAVGIASNIDVYSEVFDPMQLHVFKVVRQTKYGSVQAKLNLSRRFQENGLQFEVDAYPRITEGLYAYASFGVSNSFLFPEIRYGAELYKSLPKSLEASIGFRTLKYSDNTTIYTGSVGWYTGNDFISFRTYITPGDSGSSMSGTLSYRKYRSNADNYFVVDIGMGFSPEVYRFDFNIDEDTIITLDSQKLNIGYYFTTNSDKHEWGVQSGVSRQEIIFDPGSYFWIYSFGITWEMNFR